MSEPNAHCIFLIVYEKIVNVKTQNQINYLDDRLGVLPLSYHMDHYHRSDSDSVAHRHTLYFAQQRA